MKKLNLFSGKLLMCVCEVIVGILLLINPIGFTTSIIRTAGVILCIVGVLCAWRYFRTAPEAAQQEQGLAKGVCAILGGLFCIFRSGWFIVTFPVIAMVYGIIILVTGVVRLQWTVDMFRMKREKWYFAAAGTALSFVFAAIILTNPFGAVAFHTTFVAISLIVDAVADLVILVFIKSSIEKTNGN